METNQEVSVCLVADSITGEHKVAICSESTGEVVMLNLPQMLALQDIIKHATAYINEHGTHATESVPEDAMRH